MSLREIDTVLLPEHRAPGGFDHASVHRPGDRLYVAHTVNDSVEVIDLERRRHEATLHGFPGVAGAAVLEERAVLVATCKRSRTVALAPLESPEGITRIPVAPRPNGLALDSQAGVALAACLGESSPPEVAFIHLERRELLATGQLPGRPRWTVHDPDAGCFYVNIDTPAQILVVRAAPPFDVLRTLPMPVSGPHGLDHDRRHGILHCACDGGEVVSVEAASGRIVARVPIAGSPDVVFFNPRRERLYVAVPDPGVLQSIDTAAGHVLETISTGRGAKTFGFDDEREHVYALIPESHAAVVFAEA
jgi:DNA-binding beta-propeller fold protein YncE